MDRLEKSYDKFVEVYNYSAFKYLFNMSFRQSVCSLELKPINFCKLIVNNLSFSYIEHIFMHDIESKSSQMII